MAISSSLGTPKSRATPSWGRLRSNKGRPRRGTTDSVRRKRSRVEGLVQRREGELRVLGEQVVQVGRAAAEVPEDEQGRPDRRRVHLAAVGRILQACEGRVRRAVGRLEGRPGQEGRVDGESVPPQEGPPDAGGHALERAEQVSAQELAHRPVALPLTRRGVYRVSRRDGRPRRGTGREKPRSRSGIRDFEPVAAHVSRLGEFHRGVRLTSFTSRGFRFLAKVWHRRQDKTADVPGEAMPTPDLRGRRRSVAAKAEGKDEPRGQGRRQSFSSRAYIPGSCRRSSERTNG